MYNVPAEAARENEASASGGMERVLRKSILNGFATNDAAFGLRKKNWRSKGSGTALTPHPLPKQRCTSENRQERIVVPGNDTCLCIMLLALLVFPTPMLLGKVQQVVYINQKTSEGKVGLRDFRSESPSQRFLSPCQIYDPTNQRYEVPVSLNTPPFPVGLPENRLYNVSVQTNPFGIQIQRRRSGSVM